MSLHPDSSLGDLKRNICQRVVGLETSCGAVALFLDRECSKMVGGEHSQDSSSLRHLNIRNGDLLYARPTPVSQGESVSDGGGKASDEDMAVALPESQPGNLVVMPGTGTSRSRLIKPNMFGNEGSSTSYSLRATVRRGLGGPASSTGNESPRVHLVSGQIFPQAATKAVRMEQQLKRRTFEMSQLTKSFDPNRHPSGFVDPVPHPQTVSSIGHDDGITPLSWGQYLMSRGWKPNSSMSFDLENMPKRHLIARNGSPNTIPDPITLNRQTYRHVDFIEFFNRDEINRFVGFWVDHGMLVQRVGMLYGRYEEDEVTEGGSKAVIHGIYEPPQRIDKFGGVRLMQDPRESEVLKITKAAGLEHVGWIFTHPPRDQAITSMEAHLMAKFQNATKQREKNTGVARSQFVTVSITRNAAGDIVPRGFMVSDQGMVLDASELWMRGEDPQACEIRTVLPGSILPAVLLGKSSTASRGFSLRGDSSQQSLKSFEPERILVPIPCDFVRIPFNITAPVAAEKYQRRQIFHHSEFPVENRADYGEIQSEQGAHTFLSSNTKETIEQRVADFHFVLCMPKVFTIELAIDVATSIGKRNTLGDYCRSVLHAYLRRDRRELY